MTSALNSIKQTFAHFDKASLELSKGLRDEQLIEHTVDLIEDSASIKSQLKVIQAKDSLLGTLIDSFG